MAGGVSRLRRAAKRIGFPCASFSRVISHQHHLRKNTSSSGNVPAKLANTKEEVEEIAEDADSSGLSNKSLCAICLEPLTCGGGGGGGGGRDGGQAIFTAQCMHSFHFVCISSNVRHGSVTCPICRAQWSQLPRDLAPLTCHQQAAAPADDPILRILDDSIATFRVHRRSSLRSARYDDDDPVEPDHAHTHPRLHMALVPIPPPTEPTITSLSPCRHSMLLHHHQFGGPSSLLPPPPPQQQQQGAVSQQTRGRNGVYLSVKLSHQQAIDIVLVVSPNGPHLRLLKQSMALVVFLLRSVDRMAIVTYTSSAASRAFPLRRMTSHGKRTALQVIDRVFYLGEADPIEGLNKGAKILEDRTHRNPLACILHLSDSPTTRAYIGRDLQQQQQQQVPFPIHRFHIGFGFGASNGLVMHEFEEFLSRLLGGVGRETQLRIGDEEGGGGAGLMVRLGELRGGEERRIPLDLSADCGVVVSVGYSYIEGGVEECLRTGEVVVGMGEKGERSAGGGGAGDESEAAGGGRDLSVAGRSGNVERWDYLDPFMARRWAKHLHGYRA